ncbi:MAG: ATP-binding protein [Acidimicrobiia bacterium]
MAARADVTVGRRRELARVADALDRARAGGSACLVLVGEGGVGKTRLVTEALATAARLGVVCGVGRAPVASAPAFCVVRDALRALLRTCPLSDPHVEALAPYDRGLAVVLPEWPIDPRPHGGDLGDPRLLAAEGVIRLVQRVIAEQGPAVLVVDDLHTADPESLETLRLVSAAQVAGLALLVALRPAERREADELVRALRRDLDADIATLEPLDADEVQELVERALGATPPRELIAEILERTDGVPLLVEEVARGHLEAGTIVVEQDGAARWESGSRAVPTTIRDLVQSRLDLLDASEREVMVAGAVLGDFEPGLMREVAGADDAQIAAAIGAGVRLGLVEVADRAAVFRHAILRDAVLDAAIPHLVDTIHRRAAAALDGPDGGATRLERRAGHLAAVGADDDAALAYRDAAARLRDEHVLLGAERSARRAAQLACRADVRAVVADELARVLAAQGRWFEALELDLATAAEHGDTPDRRMRRIECALDVGRPEVAEAVLAAGRAAGDGGDAFELLAGRCALVRGDAVTARRAADAVVDSPAPDPEDRLAALELRGRVCDFLGDRDAARAAWARQARDAEASRRTKARLRAMVQLGKNELFAGEPPDRLHEAVALARDAGALVELAWAEENLAIAVGVRGDVDASIAILDEAIERCRVLRLDQLAYLLASRAMTESFRGGDAEVYFAEAEATVPTPDLLLHTTAMRGWIALRSGAWEEAVEWLGHNARLVREMPGVVPMDGACWLPWALAAAGRADEARRALDEARAMPDLARFYSRPVIVAAAAGMLAEDEAAIDAAIADAAGSMAVDVATMQVLSAFILGGSSRTRRLRAALDIFETVGAIGDVERVRGWLREAGGRVPRRRSRPGVVPDDLARRQVTPREYDVLVRVGRGAPNAEIASELFVSVRTVETHVSSLLRKLDARNRAELAVRAAAVSPSGALDDRRSP